VDTGCSPLVHGIGVPVHRLTERQSEVPEKVEPPGKGRVGRPHDCLTRLRKLFPEETEAPAIDSAQEEGAFQPLAKLRWRATDARSRPSWKTLHGKPIDTLGDSLAAPVDKLAWAHSEESAELHAAASPR
jgi:hypothetical protein